MKENKLKKTITNLINTIHKNKKLALTISHKKDPLILLEIQKGGISILHWKEAYEPWDGVFNKTVD